MQSRVRSSILKSVKDEELIAGQDEVFSSGFSDLEYVEIQNVRKNF